MLNKRLRSTIYMFFPFLFLIGYFMTAYRMERNAIEYFSLTVLSMIVCWLLLFQMYKPIRFGLPIWIMFLLFIAAYYLKFYLFIFSPEFAAKRFWLLPQMVTSENILIKTYRIIVYSFVGICTTGWLLLATKRTQKINMLFQNVDSIKASWKNLTLVLFPIIFILIITTNYIMYATHISIMAAKQVYLPFRLAGITYYTATGIVPGIFLLLIWVTYRKKYKTWFLLCISFIILHVTLQTFLRSTKGMIISMVVLITFLFAVRGNLSKKQLYIIAIIIVSIIFIYPSINIYRWVRLADPELEVLPVISKVFLKEMPRIYGGFWNIFINGFYSMLHRLTGVECLIMMIGVGFIPLGVRASQVLLIFGGPGSARIFTTEVEGIPESVIHSSATSFLGWFYMIGGFWFVILGIIIFILIMWSIWMWLLRANLRCWPIAAVTLLSTIFGSLIDGNLENIIRWGGLTAIVTILFCEFLLRTIGKTRSIPINSTNYLQERLRKY